MSIRHLDALFRPDSVAVISASDRPHSAGGVMVRNLLQGGFGGTVVPVNPKRSSVSGIAAGMSAVAQGSREALRPARWPMQSPYRAADSPDCRPRSEGVS